MSTFKVLGINDSGLATRYGSNDLDVINEILNGVDKGKTIIIFNDFKFRSNKLIIRDFDNDNNIRIVSSSETADWSITLPVLGGNRTPVFTDLAQALSNKNISGDSNTITNIGTSSIKDNAITSTKIGANQIFASHIADNAIGATEIATEVITNSKISQTAAIEPTKLKDVHKDTTREKSGWYPCSSYWELDADGLLKDLVGVGNFINNLDGSGSGQGFGTGTGGADTTAGVYLISPVSSFNGWMRSNNLPVFRFKSLLPGRSAGDTRYYCGWYTGTTLLPTSDTPLDINNGGILVGWNSTDANIKIWHGTGDGITAVPTPVDTGIAVPTGLVLRITGMEVISATNVKVTIYDGTNYSELYSTNITTDLPAGTKSINFHDVIQNPTNADKKIYFNSGFMRCLK